MDFPFEGLWLNECELGGYGTVTPHAVVSVGDADFWDDGPDRNRAGWWVWFANTPIISIESGINNLEFVATFEDGSRLTKTVTVNCDPDLRTVPGYFISLTDIGGAYQLSFEAGVLDDQPDGWSILDVAPVSLDVSEDVLFVAFNGQPAGDTRFIFTAAEFAERTSDCTPTNAVPYELLVDADNHVRQAIQLEPTLHFCFGG